MKLRKEIFIGVCFLKRKNGIDELLANHLRLLQLLKVRQFFRIVQFKQNSLTNETKTLSTN